ncbi:nitrilase-related carbon-nitrogen hydrolase [Roseisalinus antarcticus]|uniref:(R)-stereoselective amidase n=1 Tax=Roseisalinus antarcticus TaxID=254357 RepID=A0A1Y5T5Q7_9RHOB|nr:nitrilase-related carbon-nitrogen hydrolase [Roseisalinus antarcticus]SLN56389.1 (R)-stereoselective amidase [Roseisalinus antarcticus]
MTQSPWRATCIQMTGDRACQAATGAEAQRVIAGNQARLIRMIEQALAGPERPDLVVFPEFGMTGPPLGMAVPDWIRRACSTIPGPLTEPLQALARREGIYIAGNMFEAPEEWPGRYFNSSFIIGPEGTILSNYRRVNVAAFPSVHDFMTDYLRATPYDQVFPVADTPLGKLCVIACGEITVPEVARCMMMQGAEVILHPTNSRYSPAQEAAKVARVTENMMAMVSANVAGPIGFSPDGTFTGGRSHIMDHWGETLALREEADETTAVSALIDIEQLRADRRRDSGLSNPHLRARYEMYVPYYQNARFYPPDHFRDAPMQHADETHDAIARARANLERSGVLVPLPTGAKDPASTVEL